MKANERLIALFNHLQTTANKFGKEIGLKSSQNIYNILNERNGISADLATTIVSHFPNISYEWLINGDGEMIRDSYSGNHIYTLLTYLGLSQLDFAKETGINVVELYQVLEMKKPINEQMANKVIEKFPNVNKKWLLSGNGEMIVGEDEIQKDIKKDNQEFLCKYFTKLLPSSAIGGSLLGFEDDGVMEYQLEKVISPIPNADFAMYVSGDSMYPYYPSGSQVFIKRVTMSYIEWGNVYVLDTLSGTILKEIHQSEKDEHIKCVSLNPDSKFKPYDVPISEIRGLYKVLACLTIR